MFTTLWLIRSFQGMLHKKDENSWQNDWFMTVMFTMLMIGIDLLVIKLFIR